MTRLPRAEAEIRAAEYTQWLASDPVEAVHVIGTALAILSTREWMLDYEPPEIVFTRRDDATGSVAQ